MGEQRRPNVNLEGGRTVGETNQTVQNDVGRTRGAHRNMEKGPLRGRVNGKNVGENGRMRGRRVPRKKETLWYNPPANLEVRTNVAGKFLEILERSFPKGHKYSAILNRHTVKVSYSTTPNLGMMVAGMNKRKLKKFEETSGLVNNMNGDQRYNTMGIGEGI